jgi:hypothetical protein
MTNPLSNSDATLTALTDKWQQLKMAEKAATSDRLDVETRIIKMIAMPLEGSTVIVDTLKINAGFTRKWDQAHLNELSLKVLPEFFPFKLEWKEVRALSKAIEENNVDLWEVLSPALTITPSKPSFSIAPKKEG